MPQNQIDRLARKNPLRRHSTGTIPHTKNNYNVEETTEPERGLRLRTRLYRRSDAFLVRKLFKQGMSYGAASPLEIALRERNRSPPAFLAYLIIIIGIELFCFAHRSSLRLFGISLAVIGYSSTFLIQRHIRKVFADLLQQSLDGDLADIPRSYDLASKTNENDDELVRNGKSAFWVAELFEEGRRPEIMGILGFDARSKDCDARTAAELRRMVISPNYRQKGVGKHLITTAIAHAKENGIQKLVLSTPSFNKPAVGMYKRFGWKIEKTRSLPDEPKTQIFTLALYVAHC